MANYKYVDNAEFIALYNSGMCYGDMAKQFGVSKFKIQNMTAKLKAEGLISSRTKPELTERKCRTIREMYLQGKSYKTMSTAVDEPKPVIEKYIHDCIANGELEDIGEPDDRGFELDKGKIMALYKAHWTIPAIADDCDCSEDEVRDIIGRRS